MERYNVTLNYVPRPEFAAQFAAGKEVGKSQCHSSQGVFLSRYALETKWNDRFQEFGDAGFREFCLGYRVGFWESYSAPWRDADMDGKV